MNDWANQTISKIWGILQTPEWKDGEEHLGDTDITELRKLVLELDERLRRGQDMMLQGRVLGYDTICCFTIADMMNAHLEDGILYVRSNKGETPVIYSTIREVSPERNMIYAAALERLGLRKNG